MAISKQFRKTWKYELGILENVEKVATDFLGGGLSDLYQAAEYSGEAQLTEFLDRLYGAMETADEYANYAIAEIEEIENEGGSIQRFSRY